MARFCAVNFWFTNGLLAGSFVHARVGVNADRELTPSARQRPFTEVEAKWFLPKPSFVLWRLSFA
ncbi:MAG TPA: hypothetical protein VND64_11795, partial [Pirellulales bacterium]|nr:hypothetical protein [Pirellulales bacterium]